MKNKRPPKHQFQVQKCTARKRGIDWQLTFEEWWDWWQQTGHWHERGRKKGQYVMARFGDKGAYALNNIYCSAGSDNHREGVRRKMKQVYTPLGIFESCSAAAVAHGTYRAKIARWAKTNKNGCCLV